MYAGMEGQYGGEKHLITEAGTMRYGLSINYIKALALNVSISQDAHVHILSMGPEDPSAAYVSNHKYFGAELCSS